MVPFGFFDTAIFYFQLRKKVFRASKCFVCFFLVPWWDILYFFEHILNSAFFSLIRGANLDHSRLACGFTGIAHPVPRTFRRTTKLFARLSSNEKYFVFIARLSSNDKDLVFIVSSYVPEISIWYIYLIFVDLSFCIRKRIETPLSLIIVESVCTFILIDQ